MELRGTHVATLFRGFGVGDAGSKGNASHEDGGRQRRSSLFEYFFSDLFSGVLRPCSSIGVTYPL